MKKLYFIFIFSFSVLLLKSQTTYKEKTITAKKAHTFNPKTSKPDFNAVIINQEAPNPDGDSYRSFLLKQKLESRKQFPIKKGPLKREKSNAALQPQVGKGLSKFFYRKTRGGDIKQDYTGGIPNDNALAISNDGILLSGINSAIWAYDTEKDTTLFENYTLSLTALGFGSPTNRYYDPKLIYDEKADRFILVFLRDSEPATSAFMVCFSSSNNPTDPWYVYEIEGNPLDNNRWTDFPAISITDDELFMSGNLIIPNVSWQVGFDGSVIWQINKADGYNNADSLKTKLFTDIRYDGKFIRNLHAVRGIESEAPRQFFLSNRNFDVTNDTIFILEVNGTLENSSLDIKFGKTSPNYGVPPNGRQLDTDLSDPTKGLQTNDARVLGAITNGEWIQFVSTTLNPETGLAGIYHGTIENPDVQSPNISGTIIADTARDYGYPNIAFTGKDECDIETIIGFNYTSPDDFPGVAAVYYDNDGNHSEVVTLKEGLNFTNAHSDSYERWGDYFGIQRKYNEPGKVWTSGYYGLLSRRNGTWINELDRPSDSSVELVVNAVELGQSVFCDGLVQFNASGGKPPYLYGINGQPLTESNVVKKVCDGDTINYSVVDSRGCMISDVFVTEKVSTTSQGVYPNPSSSRFVAQFNLNSDQLVSAYIYNMKGVLVEEVISAAAKSGLNELQFDISPLKTGQYVLQIIGANDEEIFVEKIFKVE